MATDRTFQWDKDLPGFGLQVTATGHKSYVFQYRIGAKSRRMKLDGGWFRHEASKTGKPAAEVRGAARTVAKREAESVRGAVAQGRDPLDEMRKRKGEPRNTFKAVAEEYMSRDGKNLRSHASRAWILQKDVYPRFGATQIDAIKRSDVVALLDRIETNSGPVQADHVLAIMRRVFNWHVKRTDDFTSPIVRGMARTSPKERQRRRVLDDAELKAVWQAAEARPEPFGWLVRFILLTATRRNEAARMTRHEVASTEWTIPGKRHKSKRDYLLPLSDAAAELYGSIPAIGRKGFVFTTDGNTPISGFSKFKREFDEACGVTGWTIHDLRRTARTLMSRCGCDPDHAEMALGHVVTGIRGTYDLYAYRDEKKRVFESLAAQIERIVKPKRNVVALRGGR